MAKKRVEAIRVNVGGREFEDDWGYTWAADKEYVSGSWGCRDMGTTDIITTSDQVAGADGSELFRSMRAGERLRYRFDVPNGVYDVRLMFAEIYWTTADAEQQEVRVQGKRVLSAFNIFDQAGHDAAFEKVVRTKVTAGTLDVDFKGMSLPMHSGARISGIEVKSVSTKGPGIVKRRSASPCNVILVSFDTLRRDHLHCYGHRKKLSPVMDRIARTGVMFDDCVVNCGWTLPQHMTLLTGLYPIKHRVTYLAKPCKLSNKYKLLAEIMQENGYMTFGYGNQNGYGAGWEYGFARGMRHHTTAYPYNNMMELTPDAIEAALRAVPNQSFFLYYHTNDTHEPFEASGQFGSKWGGEYINRYEGEVSYVDHHLGRILDKLRDLGRLDNTLIVLTSDHGSEFAEHGFYEKKLNLYEEIVQIPLVMKLPGRLPSGKKVPGLCQTSDIAPTILDVCGIPRPEWMDGATLLPRVDGRKKKGAAIVFAHTFHERFYNYEHFSARTDRFKFIRCAPFSRKPDRMKGNVGERYARLLDVAQVRNGFCRELYDLANDPGEQHNIIDRAPARAAGLERRLDKWIKECGYKPCAPGRRQG